MHPNEPGQPVRAATKWWRHPILAGALFGTIAGIVWTVMIVASPTVIKNPVGRVFLRWLEHLQRQGVIAADDIPAGLLFLSLFNILTFMLVGIALGAFFRLVRFVVRRANRVRHPSR